MRVDLLRKNEVRYQGAVSRKFLLTTSISTVLGLVMLAAVIVCMGWQAKRSASRALLAQMAELEPKVARIEALRQVVAHNKKVKTALDLWRTNRQPWHQVMQDLQYQVPDSIQLGGLGIVVMDKEGRQDTRISLDGLAKHPQPEDVVVRFRRSLLEVGSLKTCFTSIKLVAFTRQTDPATKGEQAQFSIVGEGVVNRPADGAQ